MAGCILPSSLHQWVEHQQCALLKTLATNSAHSYNTHLQHTRAVVIKASYTVQLCKLVRAQHTQLPLPRCVDGAGQNKHGLIAICLLLHASG
jgi:hypothetical protein